MWNIRLDEIIHHKAMWISVEKVFRPNSKAQEKIFTSLKKTYPIAQDTILGDTRPCRVACL